MAQSRPKAEVPIEALLRERRKFPPAAKFKAQANVKDERVYTAAKRDTVKFWEQRAADLH